MMVMTVILGSFFWGLPLSLLICALDLGIYIDGDEGGYDAKDELIVYFHNWSFFLVKIFISMNWIWSLMVDFQLWSRPVQYRRILILSVEVPPWLRNCLH
jgi:hypothetical protein